ncbi:MAG: phosphatidylserine decarboxylase, partial [Planctomycetota bacterium]
MDREDRIEFYDRRTGEVRTEQVLGDAFIKWAYRTLSGRLVGPLAFGTSIPSRVLGWWFDRRWSRRRIAKTIADLSIDASEFARAPEEFRSFNDFFTRELTDGARPFPDDPKLLPSPADGRLLVYPAADGGTPVPVKGVEGPLGDLFDRPIDEFDGGSAAVVRLCPADYHRYHFPCDGTVVETRAIRGRYDSVNPIALAARPRVFARNKREITLIDTDAFGRMAFVEVGAFGVAGIHRTWSGPDVTRGREKGYFDFGGSTIVLLFRAGAVTFDADLLEQS